MVRVIYWAVGVVSLFLWTIIAPVFWIPFLVRMIFVFMVAALHDTFIDGGGTIVHAERGLGVAVNFYINGFTTIIEAIRRRGSVVGTSEQSHPPAWGRVALEMLWAIAMWSVTLWALFGFPAFWMNHATSRMSPSGLAGKPPTSESVANLVSQDSGLKFLTNAADSAPSSDPAPSVRAIPIEQWQNPKDGLVYVSIPAGTFMMGCSPRDDECSDNEKPARQVTLPSGFRLGQTEVTRAAYRRVIGHLPNPADLGLPSEELQAAFDQLTGKNPRSLIADNLPVEIVSWKDAKNFCQSAGMRLPTEIEWDYAARAGTTGARYGVLDAIAWYSGNNSGGISIHPVGRKQPNAYCLFDMLGNVREWTADNYYPGLTSDENYVGRKVVRGGSWHNNSGDVRASSREEDTPIPRGGQVGFRCAGDLPFESTDEPEAYE